VSPFDEDNLQPASYDVHLSPYLVDPFDSHRRGLIYRDDAVPYFVLPPNELWLGETSEWFNIPSDMAAKVEGRSSWGRLGLMTHITAGFVDPGFKGTITLELYNVGKHPLRLPVTHHRRDSATADVEPIAQVGFFDLVTASEKPYDVRGHYVNQEGPTTSKLSKFARRPDAQ
jgi:dCTP deaminase